MSDVEKIATGFDRGIDYMDMRKKIISNIKRNRKKYIEKPMKTLFHKIVYDVIGGIQLKNAARISESCNALRKFITNGIDDFAIVKISKSDATKKTKTGELKKMPARYRKIKWPQWFSEELFNFIKENEYLGPLLQCDRLTRRVLDYMLKYNNTNTHSLRYACANYLMHEEKKPALDVAKFMGHKNGNTILTYIQRKKVDEMYDIDM